ncbi:MAG: hypothetical protein M3Q05_12005 [Bacteroidota bacterium]|nr:hypothetical protein [Bacteroidota bacterium]
MAGWPRRGTRAGYFSFSPYVEMPAAPENQQALASPTAVYFSNSRFSDFFL